METSGHSNAEIVWEDVEVIVVGGAIKRFFWSDDSLFFRISHPFNRQVKFCNQSGERRPFLRCFLCFHQSGWLPHSRNRNAGRTFPISLDMGSGILFLLAIWLECCFLDAQNLS